jgi:hypothetical protein
VSETGRCPYCGSVPLAVDAAREPVGLEPLIHEVRRIREIAEAQSADNVRRIADLTRQVQELRATVARLRASSVAARPVPSSAAPR